MGAVHIAPGQRTLQGEQGMKALIKRQVTNRVVTLGDPIPGRQWRGPLAGAPYHNETQNAVPATAHITATGTQVRVSAFDALGRNHTGPLSSLDVGDTFTAGTQTGTLTAAPIETSGYFILELDAWPLLPDGDYLCTLGFV